MSLTDKEISATDCMINLYSNGSFYVKELFILAKMMLYFNSNTGDKKKVGCELVIKNIEVY